MTVYIARLNGEYNNNYNVGGEGEGEEYNYILYVARYQIDASFLFACITIYR